MLGLDPFDGRHVRQAVGAGGALVTADWSGKEDMSGS
jgi:hypothetical protein